MVRCVTADSLHGKYEVTATASDIYQPAKNWWLLITAIRVSDFVRPDSSRSCLENLRTATTPCLIMCFHIIDLYRGKVKFQWWFDLIIALIPHFPPFLTFVSWMSRHISFPRLFRSNQLWVPSMYGLLLMSTIVRYHAQFGKIWALSRVTASSAQTH